MVQTHKRNSKAGFTKSLVQIISKNNKTLLHKKSNANVKYVSANKTRKNNSKNKYRKIKSLKGGSYSAQSFQQVIKHFWYKNWSVNGLPGDIEQFKRFLMLCYNDIKINNGTTIIHDVLSVGRSGVMYILLNVMFNPMYFNEDGTRTGINDITPDTILDMIKEARTKRLCIVENIKQFMFICQMLGIPIFDDIIKIMLENDTAQFTYDLKAKKYTLKITKPVQQDINIKEDLYKYIKMYFDLNKDNCTGKKDENYAIVEAARYKINKIDANINASNMTEFNNNKNIRVIIAKCAQTYDEKQLFNKMLNDDTNVKRIITLSTQNELHVSMLNKDKTIIDYIDSYKPYILNPNLEKESIVISNLELTTYDQLTYKENLDLDINPIPPPIPTPRPPLKSPPPPLPPITNSERQEIIARLRTGDAQEVSPQSNTKQETPIPPPRNLLPPPVLTIPPPPPSDTHPQQTQTNPRPPLFLTIPPPPPPQTQQSRTTPIPAPIPAPRPAPRRTLQTQTPPTQNN